MSTGSAVFDIDVSGSTFRPGTGIMRAAKKWAEYEAGKTANTFPKRRNIGGFIFEARLMSMSTSAMDHHRHVEAICIEAPRG